MINLVDPIRRALRSDAIIAAMIGKDENNEIKVYTTIAKTNAQAPYVVVQIVPASGPEGAYGNLNVWEPFQIQVTSWGRSPQEAWSLADVVDNAMILADYSFEPAELALVRRQSTPVELNDRDTNLRQVIVRYELKLGR